MYEKQLKSKNVKRNLTGLCIGLFLINRYESMLKNTNLNRQKNKVKGYCQAKVNKRIIKNLIINN